jgi:hypothetical protein
MRGDEETGENRVRKAAIYIASHTPLGLHPIRSPKGSGILSCLYTPLYLPRVHVAKIGLSEQNVSAITVTGCHSPYKHNVTYACNYFGVENAARACLTGVERCFQ